VSGDQEGDDGERGEPSLWFSSSFLGVTSISSLPETPGLEVLDRLADARADLRKPPRAEQQHADAEDDQEFRRPESEHELG
jgi:hypothetical protein